MVAAIALPLLWVRTPAAVLFVALPLAGVGILYWFGRPQPRKWAQRILVVIPLVVLVSVGIEPAFRVAARQDNGNYGARLIDGNGVHLIWAPEGPGWPSHASELTDMSWNEATKRCAHLTEDGNALADSPQNIWRLPSVEEAVRSLVRHGINAGGVWDSMTKEATFGITPDKESPLWKVHSPIIYWWTSTEVNDSTVYRVVYNGGVHALHKKVSMGSLGFRAVKEVVKRPKQSL